MSVHLCIGCYRLDSSLLGAGDVGKVELVMRYIPSEKIGQNIDPLRNSFFVANYQHWTSTSALEPFLGPLDPWGALGGPWVVWGGLTTQKLPFSFRDQSKPWNGLFWLTITSYTMFLRFWVKMGPSGPKKGCFWPK